LKRVLALLKEETEISKLKEKINKQIEQKLSKQQREFFLKEQLKAIKEELGIEKEGKTAQVEEYEERLKEVTLPEEAEKVILGELEKFKLTSPQSPEFTMLSNYLDWLLGIPWGVFSKENYDVSKARKILDEEHSGLDKVKERILEFISVSKLKQSTEGSILCFVGPPGVGKTSLGQAIAKALNRKFFRFSLGGMRDEAEIKGHRRTYIGAMPGKIIQALKRCGTANPLIMLDEIDKVGHSFRGDPASALLEVLDPEQNHAFLDHYIDVNFDLSKVLFIATANIIDTIPPALLDRMDITKMAGYIKDEKIGIAQKHLIPKQMKAHGLTQKDITIRKSALDSIIDDYTREVGVRRLENTLKTIMRKTATHKAEKNNFKKESITKANLEEYLGKKKYMGESFLKLTKPGVVIGLAWTSVGGTILFIESNAIETGKGGFMQTGQLGDVMVESSRIGYSHVRSIWPKYSSKEKQDFFEANSIHLHIPAGATPKDGPSAGITMCVSLFSLASGIPVKKMLGMTGELTLTGRVLPIGGLKEKLLAAHNNKLKEVIIPEENEPDYREIPEHLTKGIKVHFVKEFSEVIKIVFGGCLWKKK
jgi:ATP-dependent Lon protease